MMHRKGNFDQTGNTRAGFKMPDVGLNGTDGARLTPRLLAAALDDKLNVATAKLKVNTEELKRPAIIEISVGSGVFAARQRPQVHSQVTRIALRCAVY